MIRLIEHLLTFVLECSFDLFTVDLYHIRLWMIFQVLCVIEALCLIPSLFLLLIRSCVLVFYKYIETSLADI